MENLHGETDQPEMSTAPALTFDWPAILGLFFLSGSFIDSRGLIRFPFLCFFASPSPPSLSLCMQHLASFLAFSSSSILAFSIHLMNLGERGERLGRPKKTEEEARTRSSDFVFLHPLFVARREINFVCAENYAFKAHATKKVDMSLLVLVLVLPPRMYLDACRLV